MRTINQLADLQKKGARKWLSDLVYYILPKANQGWTYALITKWLEEECDIYLNQQGIYRALKKYRGRYENIEPHLKVDRPKNQRKPIQKEVPETKNENLKIVQKEDKLNKPTEEQTDKSTLIETVFSELLDDSPSSIIERQKQEKDSRFKGKKW